MTLLAPLFSPAGVAIVCASRDPKKLGEQLLHNLTDYGFAGEIHPVNPDGEAILGRPSLSRIADLPEGLDLALVSLPAPEVASAVRELARRGVRVVVVLSSGFGEARGGVRAEELGAIARETGIRLVGPNCMGIYSTSSRLNASYIRELPKRPGPVSVVSQSGAYGGLILRHLASLGLGVAKFASIGNQVDVGVEDLFEYLAGDPETGLIACFLESVREGRRFVEASRRATVAKPVVVLRGGRTRAGGRAAGSHTGALAAESLAYEAAFRRGGIVSVQETEEFFDAIHALALWRGPLPGSKSVAIVTVSGGPSVIAADAAESVGLEVPLLAEPARAGLERILPPFAATGNPVDLTPEVSPAAVVPAVAAVLAEEAIDGALAVNVGLDLPEFAEGLIRAAGERRRRPRCGSRADGRRCARASHSGARRARVSGALRGGPAETGVDTSGGAAGARA
jgi:acetyltransferase